MCVPRSLQSRASSGRPERCAPALLLTADLHRPHLHRAHVHTYGLVAPAAAGIIQCAPHVPVQRWLDVDGERSR